MIMFVIFHDLHVDEYGNRQELYGCLLFYMTCVSLNHHVIALPIVGDDNHGGGATMSVVMEIMPVLWRWRSKAQEEKAISYHSFELHVMLILLCTLLLCLDVIATVA